MQSGITASAELHTAFNDFTSDPSLFALPVTITGESLTPLPAVPFSSRADLASSLPLLAPHVQPRTPMFVLLQRRSSASEQSDLVAITYIPSIAAVRAKTLFASTRATLMRELGLEKFSGGSLFCTDAEEILEPKAWEERAGSGAAAHRDEALLTREERELQGVKRAEDEERHGTKGRDLMGTGGSGLGAVAGNGHGSISAGRIQMKISDEAQSALVELGKAQKESGSAGGELVIIGIDIPTEALELISSSSSSSTTVSPSELSSKIPPNRPSFSFYLHPATSSVVFIYTCPSASKIKEKMVHASSRAGFVEMARQEGVDIAKRLEVSEPDEVSEQVLVEELGLAPKTADDAPTAGAKGGFSRPKRPGKR